MTMTITLRPWHLAAIGILAILATGLLLGATVFRTKTVIRVAAPPKVVTVTRTVLPPEDFQAEANADVRASIPSAEAYYSDNGYYTNMTPRHCLQSTPACLPPSRSSVRQLRPIASKRPSTPRQRVSTGLGASSTKAHVVGDRPSPSLHNQSVRLALTD